MFDFYTIQKTILSGEMSALRQVELFQQLEHYVYTKNDFVELIRASREAMIFVESNGLVVDIVGTGGDAVDTINISTMAMVVAASCGLQVAKHGNRGVTSQVGSSQVLEGLGVNIMLNNHQAAQCLAETNLVFLFAPLFNPAFVHAKESRSIYGKRTYFNLLGPMLNPCLATHSLVGVYDFAYAEVMTASMVESGSQRVAIVQGVDGINEISPSAQTRVFDSKLGSYTIEIEDLLDASIKHEEIASGDLAYNTKVFESVINGTAETSQIMSVCLNSGMALYLAGSVHSLRQGMTMSLDAVYSGQTLKTFTQFRDYTLRFV